MSPRLRALPAHDPDPDYVPEPPDELALPEREWEREVTYSRSGAVERTAPNCMLILCHDPAWRDVIGENVITQRLEWRKRRPEVPGWPIIEPGTPYADGHELAIMQWLALHIGGQWSASIVGTAVRSAAESIKYDPAQEWLSSLVWDGTPRLGDWVCRYLGAPPSPVYALTGGWWWQQAAARVLDPGCQADYALVLEGPQGVRKSSALRVIGGQWYRAITVDLSDRAEAGRALRGCVIGELAELATLRRTRDIEAIKSWMTEQVDIWTPKYRETEVARPRHCVFAGTTNADVYLADSTGARRWWPIQCGTIDLDALSRDRDQLWAEAAVWHREGRRRWPDAEDAETITAETDHRAELDPWQPALESLMARDGEVTIASALGAVGVDLALRTPGASSRVHAIAQRLGWTRSRDALRRGGRRERVWVDLGPEGQGKSVQDPPF